MEGLFQAIIYYRIWRRSSTGFRKAIWLAMIGTAIGAMISLVIIIIGSLSEPMWISLTPVGIARPN
jgi:hypothetical protein